MVDIISKWRTHTTAILIVGVLAIIIASAVAVTATSFQPTAMVRLGSGVFMARIADDTAERTKGLSGVKSLSDNEAVLFDFQTEGKWGIWMKDMKIPIDIIWLNEDKEVVYIVKQAPAELGTTKTYAPDKPARYVLETKAGAAAASSISIGDTAIFTIEDQQR